MLKFSILGSGSKGNSTLVVSSKTKILVDDGFSFRQLRERVGAVGESLEDLAAVFVTHEHGDHAKGLGVLTRKTDVPIYVTRDTFASFPASVGEIPRVEFFESGDVVRVADLEVRSYSISHDAVDPVSFTIVCQNAKLGFATDLGHSSHLVRERLAGCHALVLEANHCPEMLRNGDYPPELQQRIRSRVGHLSNQAMSSLLSQLVHDGLQTVVLSHLSEKNNRPDLAHAIASRALGGHSAQIHVAAQDCPTPVFEVTR